MRDFTRYEQTGDFGRIGGGRIALIALHLSAFKERTLMQQLFGVGLIKPTGFVSVPHNDYLEYLNRNGIIGLLFYLILLMLILRQIFKTLSSSTDPVTSQVACAAIGMFVIYLISSIAGVASNLFPMNCIAIMAGATFGISEQRTYH